MNLRRGDVFEVRKSPSFYFPYGEVTKVMLLQNDSGEIPCMTVCAVPVALAPYWSGCPLDHHRDWILRSYSPCRVFKRQLGNRVDTIDEDLADLMIAMIEYELGIEIPDVIEAP